MSDNKLDQQRDNVYVIFSFLTIEEVREISEKIARGVELRRECDQIDDEDERLQLIDEKAWDTISYEEELTSVICWHIEHDEDLVFCALKQEPSPHLLYQIVRYHKNLFQEFELFSQEVKHMNQRQYRVYRGSLRDKI